MFRQITYFTGPTGVVCCALFYCYAHLLSYYHFFWKILFAVGGLLNATCGNATELIIALFALHQGKISVVKSSLVGSILSNLLLVLGSSLLLGGLANLSTNQEQFYNRVCSFMSVLIRLTQLITLTQPILGFLFLFSVGVCRSKQMWVWVCCYWVFCVICCQWCWGTPSPEVLRLPWMSLLQQYWDSQDFAV